MSLAGDLVVLLALLWVRSLPKRCFEVQFASSQGEPIVVNVPASARSTSSGARVQIDVSLRLLVSSLPGRAGGSVIVDLAKSRRLPMPPARSPKVLEASARPLPTPRSHMVEGRRTGPSPSGRWSRGWEMAAAVFGWTPDLARGTASPGEITAGIAESGVASGIEVKAGQVWRGFPAPTTDEVDLLRDALAEVVGHVTMVGISLDDWRPDGYRRTELERDEFLIPQGIQPLDWAPEASASPWSRPAPRCSSDSSPTLRSLV